MCRRNARTEIILASTTNRFRELSRHGFSFNGEPQAQVKHGYDACGLPLNDWKGRTEFTESE